MKAIKAPTLEDCIWIAGFFDGEGCVGIVKDPNNKSNFILNVRMAQKDPTVLYWIQELFGGSVYKYTKANCYAWCSGASNGAKFIRAIQPYSKVKTKEIELGLLLQDSKTRERRIITEEYTAWCLELKTEINRLNKL